MRLCLRRRALKLKPHAAVLKIMMTAMATYPTFLALALPLLKVTDDLVQVERAPKERPFELRYQNFSVAMSRSRRLCCITGVNIDGSAPFFHIKRPGWKIDPRIPQEAQVGGAEFYVPTVFDRGHMVRRLDPVWGTESTARLANADTHHYTNSCPQVHSFNDMTWGDLEDWILSQGVAIVEALFSPVRSFKNPIPCMKA